MVEPDPEGINTVAPATYTPPPRETPLGSPFFDSVWSKLHGKPYVTVSAKGIANGLSDIPNDGADFGPDTPNTQTSGIQEAIDYAIASGNVNLYGQPGLWNFKMVKLLPGLFVIDDNATITINNTTNDPTGLVIEGSSENQYVTTIGKLNSLPSPIMAFSSPRGSTTGSTPAGMQFRNFSVQYFGSSANATSGVTVVDLSINETGGTITRFENLWVLSSNPINNIMLDVSGHEDSIVDNVYTRNAGGTYNSSITVASLRAHMPNGTVRIYYGDHSGIDIEAQMAILSGTTIGTGAGAGIIWRPSLNGASLTLDGVYFNGALIRLITTAPNTSGVTPTGNIIFNGGLLSKTPTASGDYMIDQSQEPVFFFFNGVTLFNNNTSDTLYLFNPNYIANVMGLKFYNYGIRTFMLNGVTVNTPPVSTPSVPASGTAQQNTNSYPVKVYINGGAITEIQITINGTAYTVYSNSTASAVYENFTLPAGASITLTYTTAPTWEWLPEW